ncbi:MAG: Asp-tRNA(Asn)/Glu-tRNA(Gln) amidotransferase subunit GatC [Bdellovibrionota bacterium]
MIDRKMTEHIATLARLKVSDQDLEQFSQQFTQILKYFEQISKVDTTNVEPLVTPTDIEAFWREDSVNQEFTAEEMTANAPLKSGNLFKVPPVV